MIDVEARVAEAVKLHAEGYNCCQAVAMAYADIIGDRTMASTMGAPFGRGISGLREVCGCVSAMAMVAGFAKPAVAPDDRAGKRDQKMMVQMMAGEFKEKNGDIVCGRLLDSNKKPCAEYVADAARIIGETMNGGII